MNIKLIDVLNLVEPLNSLLSQKLPWHLAMHCHLVANQIAPVVSAFNTERDKLRTSFEGKDEEGEPTFDGDGFVKQLTENLQSEVGIELNQFDLSRINADTMNQIWINPTDFNTLKHILKL